MGCMHVSQFEYFELHILQTPPSTKYPESHENTIDGLHVIEFVNLDRHV